MSGRQKLSVAQQRKRKLKATEEARKSSKILVPITSELGTATTEKENDEKVHSSVSENSVSDAESLATNDESLDRLESPSQEDQSPQSTSKTHPVIIFNDIGFLNFNAAGRPYLDNNTKETLVKIGADAFRHEDATLPETQSGKSIARGMTKSWFEKTLPNGQQVPCT